MNKDKACLVAILTVTVVSISILFLSVYFENNHVTIKKTDEYEVLDDGALQYEIEDLYAVDGDFYIKGRLIAKDIVYDYYNYGEDLHDRGPYNNMRLCLIDDSQCYIFPTKLKRPDNMVTYTEEAGYCCFYSRIPDNIESINSKSFGMIVKYMDGAQKIYVLSKIQK